MCFHSRPEWTRSMKAAQASDGAGRMSGLIQPMSEPSSQMAMSTTKTSGPAMRTGL